MERDSYLFGFVNASVFTFIACAYLLLINNLSKYSHIHVFQELVAKTAHMVQTMLGIDVMLQDTALVYPRVFVLKITLLCTGINEIILFSLLLLGFIGVSFKTKLKGYMIFFPIILLENLTRIILIRPLATLLGEEKALAFHNVSFKCGQIAFVILLVVVWFHLFAKGEFKRSVQSYKRAKRLKSELLRQKRKR